MEISVIESLKKMVNEIGDTIKFSFYLEVYTNIISKGKQLWKCVGQGLLSPTKIEGK